MVGKFADVGRGSLVRATRIEGAAAVAGTINRDQSHAFAGGDVCDGSEVAVRAGRAMQSEDGRAVTRTKLTPREIAAVCELEHSEIIHRAQIARSGAIFRAVPRAVQHFDGR